MNSLIQGNTSKLLELVSENVVFYSDGGGKVRAAQIPIIGFDKVINLHHNLLRMYEGKYSYSFLIVNGLPGIRINIDGNIQYIYSICPHSKLLVQSRGSEINNRGRALTGSVEVWLQASGYGLFLSPLAYDQRITYFPKCGIIIFYVFEFFD